jgi:prevent-host-death family protein
LWAERRWTYENSSAEEVRAQFDAYLKATAKGPVVVTRNAKPVAVLLSVKDRDEIERMAMSRSKKLRKILQKSQAQIKKGKGIPHEQFWREIEQMRKG